MKINLKQLGYQCNTLDMVISDMDKKPGISIIKNDLKAIYELITSIRDDIRFGGEAITELDMSLAEANQHAYGNPS